MLSTAASWSLGCGGRVMCSRDPVESVDNEVAWVKLDVAGRPLRRRGGSVRGHSEDSARARSFYCTIWVSVAFGVARRFMSFGRRRP